MLRTAPTTTRCLALTSKLDRTSMVSQARALRRMLNPAPLRGRNKCPYGAHAHVRESCMLLASALTPTKCAHSSLAQAQAQAPSCTRILTYTHPHVHAHTYTCMHT
mmetsp:Transcript_464/g.945  ORF Transcript_464/g.945 Transcript_464/m.945 type:complete len:106 (-) Transcript_464:1312-1629(-)